ncbi:cell division protein FtsL [Terrilactibacillus sp. BCM23-1]|uniref:Cell division protein FtsL n=1 Tax=Terrilactibacillus tamarindi TaxID=2599694 RepID=A0A6N8CQR3_9BACI|nr:cell division protein FtsL [Terrilactibacillus tamarindi]MTT32010.1 cell division protein FtsL [Terrilactibacillus tamarindi]
MNLAARHLEEKEQVQPKRSSRVQKSAYSEGLPQRRITKGEKILWFGAGMLIVALTLIIVSYQARLFFLNGSIQNLQDKVAGQAKINQQLKVEQTNLSSPERIMKYAKEKLGLNLNIKNVKVISDR